MVNRSFIPMLAVVALALTGCAGDGAPDHDDLESVARVYTQNLVGGSPGQAWEYFTDECKSQIARDVVEGAWSHMPGDENVESIDVAYESDTEAVSTASLDSGREESAAWVFIEGQGWRMDDCVVDWLEDRDGEAEEPDSERELEVTEPATVPPVPEPPRGPAPAPQPVPPPPASAAREISHCGLPSQMYERGTTFYTDGTSGWTQYCHDQSLLDTPLPPQQPTHVPDYGDGPSSGEVQMRYACEQASPYVTAEQCGSLGFPYGG
ncbi:hypothetical protein [Hoyosella altamirensis]|uniref:Lipoprotein n=1 Tax=Hoyosella altamirensis TaxID=616997 RepID=A0A839RUR5_9ACTN|nr:hypothetical protein [Hoyosella altamirensis]MBB3039804.1 hypothetical protein [Hoyosella altamirensis]